MVLTNEKIEAKVIKVIDDKKIVINKGIADNVAKGQRFQIYYLGEEILDPDTQESLGKLEIICGEAIVEHPQEKMSTLVSDLFRLVPRKITRNGLYPFVANVEETTDTKETIPFENITNECLARRIR
ncbi:MAG: hypothetical protein FWE23_05285 [Chitinivibrionia bacterium]|nr:hypothetical protein [Chitinivibrionia bacterium]